MDELSIEGLVVYHGIGVGRYRPKEVQAHKKAGTLLARAKTKNLVPVNAINSHNSPFAFEKGTFLSSFENAPTHVGAKEQSII